MSCPIVSSPTHSQPVLATWSSCLASSSSPKAYSNTFLCIVSEQDHHQEQLQTTAQRRYEHVSMCTGGGWGWETHRGLSF